MVNESMEAISVPIINISKDSFTFILQLEINETEKRQQEIRDNLVGTIIVQKIAFSLISSRFLYFIVVR